MKKKRCAYRQFEVRILCSWDREMDADRQTFLCIYNNAKNVYTLRRLNSDGKDEDEEKKVIFMMMFVFIPMCFTSV